MGKVTGEGRARIVGGTRVVLAGPCSAGVGCVGCRGACCIGCMGAQLRPRRSPLTTRHAGRSTVWFITACPHEGPPAPHSPDPVRPKPPPHECARAPHSPQLPSPFTHLSVSTAPLPRLTNLGSRLKLSHVPPGKLGVPAMVTLQGRLKPSAGHLVASKDRLVNRWK